MARPKGAKNKQVAVPEAITLSDEEKIDLAAEIILEMICQEHNERVELCKTA